MTVDLPRRPLSSGRSSGRAVRIQTVPEDGRLEEREIRDLLLSQPSLRSSSTRRPLSLQVLPWSYRVPGKDFGAGLPGSCSKPCEVQPSDDDPSNPAFWQGLAPSRSSVSELVAEAEPAAGVASALVVPHREVSVCSDLRILEGMGDSLPGPAVPLHHLPEEQDFLETPSMASRAKLVSDQKFQKLSLLPEDADDLYRLEAARQACDSFCVNVQRKLALLPELDDAECLFPDGFHHAGRHPIAAVAC